MTDILRSRAARTRPHTLACALLGGGLALAGCGGAPLPVITAGPDPADPRAAAATPRQPPVMAGTVDHRPVAPRAWRDMNRRVTPGAGGVP